MLPNEMTAVGLVAVPQAPIDVTSSLHVAPEVTVQPRVDVTVTAPHSSPDAAYMDAMNKQAAMGGSGSVMGGA